VIENKNGKDIYIVHYNSFVFGTNFSKMIIIREKEEEQEDPAESDSKIPL
jgi:hypothetical protein